LGKARGSYKAAWIHPSCIECNEPVARRNGEKFARWRLRKYCGECRKAIHLAALKKANERRQKIKDAEALLTNPPIPELSFAEHNIKPRDGGFIRLSRPATYVETISSMGNL
jgi:hypothetical protein